MLPTKGVAKVMLTTSNSIAYGQHFISASTIQSTCDALIHLVVMDNTLTNQVHPKAWQLLNHLLLLSLSRFKRLGMASGEYVHWNCVEIY
jgi:hypothetical protein